MGSRPADYGKRSLSVSVEIRAYSPFGENRRSMGDCQGGGRAAREDLHAPWPQKVTLFFNDFSSFFLLFFGCLLVSFWPPFEILLGSIFDVFFNQKLG